MHIPELARKAPAPRASRQIDRDTARRMRAFPIDQCEVSGDKVLVPMHLVTGATQSMLGSMFVKIQALELDIAVLKGYGAPIEASESQPMISLVTAEKAKSTHSPMSVPGNEAEDLTGAMSLPLSSSKDDTHPKGEVVKPTKYRESNVVPIHPAFKGDNYSPPEAANDATSEQVETAQKANTVTVIDGGHGILDGLAEGYGMSIVEAAGILGSEYAKRDRHCRQYHDGKSRADVQLSRMLAQLPNETVQTGYLVWSYQKQRDVPTAVVVKSTFRQPQERRNSRQSNAWSAMVRLRLTVCCAPPPYQFLPLDGWQCLQPRRKPAPRRSLGGACRRISRRPPRYTWRGLPRGRRRTGSTRPCPRGIRIR